MEGVQAGPGSPRAGLREPGLSWAWEASWDSILNITCHMCTSRYEDQNA